MKLLQAEVFCSAQPQNIKDWRVNRARVSGVPTIAAPGAGAGRRTGQNAVTNVGRPSDSLLPRSPPSSHSFSSLATPYHPLSSVRGSNKDTTYLHSPSCSSLCVPSFLYLKTFYAHILNSTNTLIADCSVTYVINTKHTALSAKVIDAYIKAALP